MGIRRGKRDETALHNQLAFAKTFVSNGFKASSAVRDCGAYKTKDSQGTLSSQADDLLKTPLVKSYVSSFQGLMDDGTIATFKDKLQLLWDSAQDAYNAEKYNAVAALIGVMNKMQGHEITTQNATQLNVDEIKELTTKYYKEC